MIPYMPRPFPTSYQTGLGLGALDWRGQPLHHVQIPKHDPRDGALARIQVAFLMHTRDIIEAANTSATQVGESIYNEARSYWRFELFTPRGTPIGSISAPLPRVVISGAPPNSGVLRGTSQYVDPRVFETATLYPGTGPDPIAFPNQQFAHNFVMDVDPTEWQLTDADVPNQNDPASYDVLNVYLPYTASVVRHAPISVSGAMRARITPWWQCTVWFNYLPSP